MKRDHGDPFRGSHCQAWQHFRGISDSVNGKGNGAGLTIGANAGPPKERFNPLLAPLPPPRVPPEAPYGEIKVVLLASRPEPNRKWPSVPVKERPAIRAGAASADDLTAPIDPAKLKRHLSNPADPGRFHHPHSQNDSILPINAPVEVKEGMVGYMEGKVRRSGDAGGAQTPDHEEGQYR